MIIVHGDCYINGTITMAAKFGCYISGHTSFHTSDLTLQNNITGKIINTQSNGATNTPGDAGSNGTGGGGGYSGKSSSISREAGIGGSVFGGGHGAGYSSGTNASACSPGTSSYGGAGGRGGACIFIIVLGSIVIGSSGIINTNGGNATGGMCGGGGGGPITIAYGVSYLNSGSLYSSGGAGGSGSGYGTAGYAGGSGSKRSFKINFKDFNRDFLLDITPHNMISSITRWVHFGSKDSKLGNFELPYSENILEGQFVKINSEWSEIKNIETPQTLNSITLDKPITTGRVNYITPLCRSVIGDYITISGNYDNNFIGKYTCILDNYFNLTNVSFFTFDIVSSSDCYFLVSPNLKTWYWYYNSKWSQINLSEDIIGNTRDELLNLSYTDNSFLTLFNTMYIRCQFISTDLNTSFLSQFNINYITTPYKHIINKSLISKFNTISVPGINNIL